MEPAAAFLELWDRAVPSDIGIAGLDLLPPEVEASYVLLLCMVRFNSILIRFNSTLTRH